MERPTLLACVFSIYKLTFRKKTEGKSKSKTTQMNLLVMDMENFLYNKQFTKTRVVPLVPLNLADRNFRSLT